MCSTERSTKFVLLLLGFRNSFQFLVAFEALNTFLPNILLEVALAQSIKEAEAVPNRHKIAFLFDFTITLKIC